MASNPWQQDFLLSLKANPQSYDFCQLLNLVEKNIGATAMNLGGLKLAPLNNLKFPPADVSASKFNQQQLEITLGFMGLYGVDAAMPMYMIERINQGDNGALRLKAFLDIFNHRFYLLLYQAWKARRPDVSLALGEKKYLRLLSLLSGNHLSAKETQAIVPYFAKRSRNASGLKKIVQLFFKGLSVSIQQSVPVWTKPRDNWPLGDDGLRLGDTSFLGARILDSSSKINIHIEASKNHRYDSLKQRAQRLSPLLQDYLGTLINFDIYASIYHQGVCVISQHSLQLGQGVYLGRAPCEPNKVMLVHKESK